MSDGATTTFLTQEAHDRLRAELAHLAGPGMAEIAKRIEAARIEGDLKENGGYHAAKEEQGKMDLRIRQLTQLLEHARVGETPPDDGIVEPGMLVTVEMFGDTETFLLGRRDPRQEGRRWRHVCRAERHEDFRKDRRSKALHRLTRPDRAPRLRALHPVPRGYPAEHG